MTNGKDKKPDISVTLCIMAYRGIEADTLDCVIKELIPLAVKYKLNYHRSSNDALVSRARSRAITTFFDEQDADVFVMIDHDMVWAQGDVCRLVESCLKTKGLVGGVCSKRAFGKGIACRFEGQPEFETGTDELIPASYVGSAFMAVHKDACKLLARDIPKVGYADSVYYPWFSTEIRQHPDDAKVLEELSEDWAFAARLRDRKVPIHVDAMPTLVHMGQHGYTVADAYDDSR